MTGSDGSQIIEIYTTAYCGYCVRAKDLLTKRGIPYHEIDVTADDSRRQWLVEASGGRRTVPQIFIRGRSIGGYQELAALAQSGELDRLLAEPAGVPPAR